MKLLITGVEPQFKIYKITDAMNNKVHIGSTFYPIKVRMSAHKHLNNKVDQYFANVVFHNVTTEIIDSAHIKEEMKQKEDQPIENFENSNPELCLNKIKAYTGMTLNEYSKQYYQCNRYDYRNYVTPMTDVMCVKHVFKGLLYHTIRRPRNILKC